MRVQSAMVWGAGGGIGRALVSILREEGWRVLAMGRHATDLGDLTPHVFEVDVAAYRDGHRGVVDL